jgi:hypothetical protein
MKAKQSVGAKWFGVAATVTLLACGSDDSSPETSGSSGSTSGTHAMTSGSSGTGSGASGVVFGTSGSATGQAGTTTGATTATAGMTGTSGASTGMTGVPTSGTASEEPDGGDAGEADASPADEGHSDGGGADASAGDSSHEDAGAHDAGAHDAAGPAEDATVPEDAAKAQDASEIEDANAHEDTTLEDADHDAAAPTDAGHDAPAVDGPTATFTMIYDTIISDTATANCTGCHNEETHSGALDMSTRLLAYANLVGVTAAGPACGASGLKRVNPGDVAASLLYNKVASKAPNGPAVLCGSPMPHAPNTYILTPVQLDMIASWINAGAVND